jgi:predicted nucleotidyltransferase
MPSPAWRSARTGCWLPRELPKATGSRLTDLNGIGPSGAARRLVEAGDMTRFPSRAHFASWNGTAPIDASSGDQVRHRLSRAGNRQINRTLHMIAVVHLSNPTEGRAYYDRKVAAGKTPMEAMRCPYLATMTWERRGMPVPVQGDPAARLTLAALRGMRGRILEAASRRGLDDVRVFGSVARGEAGAASDVDLLVAPGPQTTLFDLSGFALDVEEIVGRHVDVATPRGLKVRIKDRVLAEAVAL